MPKLSVIDLAMFLLETHQRPFNVGPLVLLRPPKGQPRRFADKLVQRMLEHPPGPPFNYKLSLSLTSAPSLEPLDHADLSRHVHRLTLDGDGSMNNLLEQVCTLHETPLDRSGLLWQFYVIDGLADGRVALYGKVHHGTIDGRTFVQAVTHWFSTDPADPEVRALWQGVPRASHARDKLEAGLGEAGSAIVGTLRKSMATASGIVSSSASLYRMLAAQGLRSLGLNDKAMALPFLRVPRVLSGKPSSKRNYAFTTLPLGELKAIGKNAGATVNDTLLAVLDGALDRYLAGKPRRARKPLVVDMPVALTGASGGNQIAVLQLAMGLPGMSLRERLDAIRKETSRVKAAVKDNPTETVMLYTTLVHSLPILLERVGISRPLLVSNLLFSNPFGLEKRCYLMGAEVELALPMSVVAAGQMLNVTVVTLAEKLQIGFLGIPGAVDRIERLAECTLEAFEELKTEFGTCEPPAPATEPVSSPRVAVKTARAKRTPAGRATPKAVGMKRPAARRGARKAVAT
jgi:diacylglycerol O-acyltransferase / wax synthase